MLMTAKSLTTEIGGQPLPINTSIDFSDVSLRSLVDEVLDFLRQNDLVECFPAALNVFYSQKTKQLVTNIAIVHFEHGVSDFTQLIPFIENEEFHLEAFIESLQPSVEEDVVEEEVEEVEEVEVIEEVVEDEVEEVVEEVQDDFNIDNYIGMPIINNEESVQLTLLFSDDEVVDSVVASVSGRFSQNQPEQQVSTQNQVQESNSTPASRQEVQETLNTDEFIERFLSETPLPIASHEGFMQDVSNEDLEFVPSAYPSHAARIDVLLGLTAKELAVVLRDSVEVPIKYFRRMTKAELLICLVDSERQAAMSCRAFLRDEAYRLLRRQRQQS